MTISVSAKQRPIIHIGPSKTATTSLQESVIPFLGRPYQVKPAWVHRVTRDEVFQYPELALPSDIVVSDERLGTFVRHPPEVVAERLAAMFPDAVILYVLRNPIELFYSVYRQGLVNFVDLTRLYGDKSNVPATADYFFKSEWARYHRYGVGFFSMLNLKKIQRAFGRFFTVETIEFGLLKDSPQAFVAAFTRACGNEMNLPLPRENRADREVMENALAMLSTAAPQSVHERCREYYEFSRLSPAREDFLRRWKYNVVLEEFAAAFRF